MKHLVILLGGYYPTYSAPGLVIEKMLPELKKQFRISVLTVRRTVHTFGKEFTFNDVHVFEHSYFLNDRVVESRFLQKRSFPFWRVLEKILMRFQKGLESHTFHTGNAYGLLEQIFRNDPFASLLAVSFPVEVLQVGAMFKKSHPDVNFVTYSTDTWHNHPNLRAVLNRLFFCGRIVSKEQAAYRDADYCFFSQEIFRNSREAVCPITAKASPLNYLLTFPSGVKQLSNAERAEGQIVYAGTFSREYRNPQYFVDVLDVLFRSSELGMSFHFYLVTSECSEMIKRLMHKYPDKIYMHPPTSGERIRKIIGDAAVLLNFSNNLDNFSPSKIFDYAATGLPIINVVYKGRVKSEVFLRYPYLLEIENFWDAERDAKRLHAFLSEMAGKRMAQEKIHELYSEYVPRNALAEMLEKLGAL